MDEWNKTTFLHSFLQVKYWATNWCFLREHGWPRRKRKKHLQLNFVSCLLARTLVRKKQVWDQDLHLRERCCSSYPLGMFFHQCDLKSSWDYTLCWRWATVQKTNLWYLNPEGFWFSSQFIGAVAEQYWILLSISCACGCIWCNDLSGWKIHAVSDTGTSADCKVVAHQLKQGILPTTELSQSGFITPRRHKDIIYTIFGGKMPRICVSTSSVSCVTPGSTAGGAFLLLSALLSAVWVLLVD